MADVSPHDEQDRPDATQGESPEVSGQPSPAPAPPTAPADDPDFSDTRPLHPSAYPPPSPPQAGERPGPWQRPYGDPSAPPTAPYPGSQQAGPPPYGAAAPQGQPGYHHPGFPPPAAPHPGAQHPGGQRPGSPSGEGRSRLPGWAWPTIAALSLVIGVLGGVLGGVAVSMSMSDTGTGSIPVIGTDTNGAKPLAADNGSVAAVAAKLLPSTVQVQANGGADGQAQGGATGSGFVVDDHDHVITNNHVVADATGAGELKVVDQNGKKHDAKIIGRSPVYDIAVLEVADGHGITPASIGSSKTLHVGDTVVAIGSPLGLSSTVTAGIVSAVDRPVTTGNQDQSSYINAVQTDAAINPGNSGGPLVNLRGQVVGVNSAIATTGSSIGGESGNIGVGFAIPMEQVRITASQILATGKARYPVIGANVNTVSHKDGAEIVGVPLGTPAAKAGLEKGDLVTKVDNQPITDGISLIVAIRSHQPGQTVTLRVDRGGKQREVRVTLDAKVG